MFLKLDSLDKGEEKDFILNTLLLEFDDVVKKNRKIFPHYGCLTICTNITHALKTRDKNLIKFVDKTEK